MAYQRDKDCLPSTSDALPVLFCFVWSWLSHWLNRDYTNRRARGGHWKWRADNPCPYQSQTRRLRLSL
ncbi:hypothetical protein DVH24_042487 [Malus domestica]|uniref:Uncharacterized protein n=1 Tax=Malus domestica TaxID=3750 RepID=A0A498HFE2_MALDO|nr:hypothetical protein DVH24_042487 [Malus domestica]